MNHDATPAFVAKVVGWITSGGLIFGAVVSFLSYLDKLPAPIKERVDGWFTKRVRQQPQPEDVVREEIGAELKEMHRLMTEQDERHRRDLKDERCRAEAERKSLADVQQRQQGQIDYLWTAVGGLRQYGHRAYGEIIRLDPGTEFPKPPSVEPPPWQ